MLMGLIIGFLIGGILGILLMAMMYVAKKSDNAMENECYPWERKGYRGAMENMKFSHRLTQTKNDKGESQ